MNTDRNRAALDRLYREHKDHVFNYLSRLTCDRELARDVTQQTFLKLLTDPNIVSLDSPKAYLFTVARNTLYDEWKRKKERLLADGEEERVNAMPDDPLQTPQEQAATADVRDKVEAAIGLMHPKFRELMLLRYGEDLSIEEIAQVTGRGLSDVKVNLHRARLVFDKDFTALMYARVASARGKCREMTALLAPFEERELPADKIKAVDRHLLNCKLCADDAGEMKRRRELFIALPLIPTPLALDRAMQHRLTPAPPDPASIAVTEATAAKTATSSIALKLVAVTSIVAGLAGGGFYLVKDKTAPPVDTPRTGANERAAPAPLQTAAHPVQPAGEAIANIGSVQLAARAVEGGKALSTDVFWTVYKLDPIDGKRTTVTAGGGATPIFKLPAGRYLVEASQNQGKVRAEREVTVEAGKITEHLDIVLGSGQLNVAARLTAQSPILSAGVFWSVKTIDPSTGARRSITANGNATPSFTLASGRYVVEASLNQGKVRVEREVVVAAGKTIEHHDFVLNAGTMVLTTQAGADAPARQIGWTVHETTTGKRNMVASFPGPGRTNAQTVLPAGRYIVVLYHGARTTEREVTVIAGQSTKQELALP